MDAFLDKAWRSGMPPFHGITVEPAQSLPLVELRAALASVAFWIEEQFKPDGVLMLDDWHRHDGFVKPASASTWTEVRPIFGDENKLRTSGTGDFEVFRAVYPPSADWLLRWYIDDEESESVGGEFSVSIAATLAPSLERLLGASLPIVAHPSSARFASLYAG